jgi:hypothetical protein
MASLVMEMILPRPFARRAGNVSRQNMVRAIGCTLLGPLSTVGERAYISFLVVVLFLGRLSIEDALQSRCI